MRTIFIESSDSNEYSNSESDGNNEPQYSGGSSPGGSDSHYESEHFGFAFVCDEIEHSNQYHCFRFASWLIK